MLLPYDLKEWIPENDIVHFVIEAVEMLPLGMFSSNYRNSGSEQYHPHLLLALLLYCYTQGVFSSRKIERATWKDVAVRYLCGNQHPDHDTICDFRVRNEEAIAGAFLTILKMAKECGILKVGMVSVDGTKINANASINRSIRYDRARALEEQLKGEIGDLMAKAHAADASDQDRGDSLGPEIQRLSELREKMRKAQETLERQAKEKAVREQEEYEKRCKAKGKKPRERKQKGPPKPEGTDQTNLTDPDSGIMRKNSRGEYRQAYNPQAVVDAEGTQLILGSRVTNRVSDSTELESDLDTIPAGLGFPSIVLADAGFVSETQVIQAQRKGVEVLMAIGRYEQQGRKHDFRPPRAEPAEASTPRLHELAWITEMKEKMGSPWAKALYRLRKQTVEPVFGVIKHNLGFRQFLLRGLGKVQIEWTLIACAYNIKRLSVLLST